MAATYRMKTAKRTDTRVKFMNEIIQGIQVIKMYVWENSFAKMIENVRRKEVNAIRGSAYVRATLVSFFMISRLSIFLSLVTYVYFGNVITARKVFIVSSFYNILNESMVHFWPMAITCCAEGYISVKRVQEFMMIKEKATVPAPSAENGVKNGGHANGISLSNGISPHGKPHQGISMDGVTAEWSLENDEKSTGLSGVTFKATEAKLCVIIGTVGSGKSTFLNVVLKELPISAGKLTVTGKVSYAAQEAWLFNGSIKNNILFIEDYDEKRYRDVIRVCALEKDLEIWPHGDETIVGEKGVSLSGGQKARVNLARAIYRRADIYLLDDPLSAVDANVGKHIFDKCIKEFLADKVCILVTHQLQYLKHVPHIVLMQAGHIEAQGTYKELISTKAYMIQSLAASTESAEGEGDAKVKETTAANNAGETEEKSFEKQEEEQEHQSTGTVNWGVYRTYFKAVNSYFYTAVIFLLFVLAQVAVSSVDYFVAQWVNWEESVAVVRSDNLTEPIDVTMNSTKIEIDENDDERQRYIYIYAILMGLFTYLIVHRTFAFFHLCLRISNNLHDQLFRGITRAKMYFFNTNPSGRIINRFSNDIGSIDTKLPGSLHDTIQFFLEMIAVVVIVGIVNYWFLLPTVVMSLVLFGLRKIYVTTSRSVKRIESLSKDKSEAAGGKD
jgi:ATP-binding cassette, subfamily C (CFTR/MRP), member 4